MNIKKSIYFLIGVVLIVGIVGKIYMYNQQVKAEQRQEEQKLKAEKKAARAIKNTFKDVKLVEFKKTKFYKSKDSYRMFIKMTNKADNQVNFNTGFMDGDKALVDYGIENRDVQVEGVTKDTVQVIYTNQTEEEL